MKKDEILQQSHDENPDEKKEETDNKAFIYGMVTVVFVSFVFIAWNAFNDKPYAWDISAIICSALAVGAFVKYKDNKKIGYLIVGLLAAILTIISFIMYVTYGV